MDCSDLDALVINRQPIELIDIRSKDEFTEMHIRGARSLPFRELTTPGLYRRLHPTTQVVCVISSDGQARASLATGILRSAGCVNAVVLEGGMKDWTAQGFPVFQKRGFRHLGSMVAAGAVLAGLGAAVAFAIRENLIGFILFVIMAAFATKACSLVLTKGYLTGLGKSIRARFALDKALLKTRYHSRPLRPARM